VTELLAIIAGAALSTVLLALAHLVLWHNRAALWLVWRYAIGVAALNAGTTLAGLLSGNLLLALAPWCIALPAGSVVALLHAWRAHHERPMLEALARRAFEEYRDARET
jgi:hypothetical protein